MVRLWFTLNLLHMWSFFLFCPVVFCSQESKSHNIHYSLTANLHSGATDSFEFSSKHLGEIAGICLGHITKDGKKVKKEVFWHVMEVVVTEMELGNK